MKGFVDYLISSEKEVCNELRMETADKEITRFMAECRDIARDEEISTPVMFRLLRGCNMELETFDYAADLDELATGVRMNTHETALWVLISGLEKRYPEGISVSHI